MMNTTAPAIHGEIRASILKAATSIGILGVGASGAPRIMAAIGRPEVTAPQLSAMLAKEPALYARVLRVANSSYYGHARNISTVERALVLLGLSAVRGIAAAACLDRTLALNRHQQSVDMKALMLHSHATAVASQMIAEWSRPSLSAEAFIVGLLHNLGVVVQIQMDGNGVKEMVQLRNHGDCRAMRVLETDVARVTHEECIAVVFEAWQMPDAFVESTRFHHEPMGAPALHRDLACLVNLGATLGLSGGNTFNLEPAAVTRNAPAMAHLGLTDEQLDQIAEAMPIRLAELSSALLSP